MGLQGWAVVDAEDKGATAVAYTEVGETAASRAGEEGVAADLAVLAMAAPATSAARRAGIARPRRRDTGWEPMEFRVPR